MSLWTIVPIRGLASGKSRLATILDPQARRDLNTGMLVRTLRAIEAAIGSLDRCIVISAKDDARALADMPGLNAALELARDRARQLGATRLLILPSDLPDIDRSAVRTLLDTAPAAGATLIADKSGQGTNGLLLPADAPLAFMFGESSLARHRAALEALRLPICEWHDPALAFDLDTLADYRSWRSGQRQPA
jgi:2-phospho-L-lactate guanylyltransferase